jgi:5-methyltetrahydrofolate--homocysteine methyltransferase
MEALAMEMARAGAECARRAADAVEKRHSDRVCFVAGAIGPTTRTSSISTDVNNPAARGCTYDELVTAYSEQIRGLLDGGADILLVETIFDTLNAKAAFFAIQKLFDEGARRVPIMASVTFIQAGSNRGVTGQTIAAFWNSISHVPLLSVGMNCALGPTEMRPLIEELSRTAPIYVSCYPNAGLPDEDGKYLETPTTLAAQLEKFVNHGWLNFVGGCCGTTEKHILAIAQMVERKKPRQRPAEAHRAVYSGIETIEADDATRPLLVGERTNVIGSRLFKGLVAEEKWEEASEIARRQAQHVRRLEAQPLLPFTIKIPQQGQPLARTLFDRKAFRNRFTRTQRKALPIYRISQGPYRIKEVIGPILHDEPIHAVGEDFANTASCI